MGRNYDQFQGAERQTMIFKDEGSILQYVRDDTVVGDFMFVKDKNCVE